MNKTKKELGRLMSLTCDPSGKQVRFIHHSYSFDEYSVQRHLMAIDDFFYDIMQSESELYMPVARLVLDKHGRQWTGEWRDIERVVCLGLASGMIELNTQRRLWRNPPDVRIKHYVAPLDELNECFAAVQAYRRDRRDRRAELAVALRAGFDSLSFSASAWVSAVIDGHSNRSDWDLALCLHHEAAFRKGTTNAR